MAAFNTKNPFEKLHGDVLNTEPSSEEEKTKLVAEIKERGNRAFKARRMEEADMLYSRAIELDGSMHALYGNRSAVNHTMGKYEKALDDAIMAIQCKPDWAKGYFRKGNALLGLKRPHAAQEALEQSLKLEGKANKSVQKVLEKAIKLGSTISREEEESAHNVNKDDPSTTRNTRAASNNTSEILETKRTAQKLTGKDVVRSNNHGEVSKSDVVRGYKKTKDGRTTTFFHRDIDDEAKKLIGNIAPKKIDPVKLKSENDPTKGDGSAWNKGGTYEEKNISDWAKNRLRDLLLSLSIEYNNDITIEVCSMRKLDGEAQVFVMRGTKRFMFEFNVVLEWKVSDGKDPNFDFAGTLEYPDLSTDACGDYEVNAKVIKAPTNSISDALRAAVLKKEGAFQTEVRRVVGQFEEEFIASSFKK